MLKSYEHLEKLKKYKLQINFRDPSHWYFAIKIHIHYHVTRLNTWLNVSFDIRKNIWIFRTLLHGLTWSRVTPGHAAVQGSARVKENVGSGYQLSREIEPHLLFTGSVQSRYPAPAGGCPRAAKYRRFSQELVEIRISHLLSRIGCNFHMVHWRIL